MKISRVSFAFVLCSAALHAQAATPCPAAPASYRELPFGETRFALEETCERLLSHDEQFFAAGAGEKLATKCKLPRDAGARSMVEQFAKSIALVIAYTGADVPLDAALRSQAKGAAAYAAGSAAADALRCEGPDAALLARGIVKYLRRTAENTTFASSCVAYYGGRYREDQCRCMADVIRAALPAVHQRRYEPGIIKDTIGSYPFIGARLMVACGLWNY